MRLPSTVSGLRLRALRLLHSWLRLHSLWLLHMLGLHSLWLLHPRLHMLHVCALLHTWLLCTLLSLYVLLLCMLLHPLR
jgi:hypothetical protein